MKLDTGVIWLAAVLLLFAARARAEEPATQPATRPADCFSLTTDDAGRFVFRPLLWGRITLGNGRYWTCEDDSTPQLDNYKPACWFGSRVTVRGNADRIEIAGWRDNYSDWQVISAHFIQTADGATAEYLIRTPVGMPDRTITVREPHTALLFLRHQELLPMLAEILDGLGVEPYQLGAFVRAQMSGDVSVSAETAAQARELVRLTGCDNWRNREAARRALEGMGLEGAKAMLALRRDELTPCQRQAVDVCLSAWPVIERKP